MLVEMALKREVFILFGVLAFCGAVSEGNLVIFRPCKGGEPMPDSVDITPCPKQPCVFVRGTTVNSTIAFKPQEVVTSGTIAVYGIFQGLKVPFPLANPNPCEGHGIDCPLKENFPEYLKISIPVKQMYPTLELVAQFDLKDQAKKDVFCFQISAEIS